MIEQLILAWELIPIELLNTLYMVAVSGFFSSLFGLILGIFLWLWKEGSLKPSPFLYRSLSFFVNVGRSIPFAILIIAIIPFTRFVVGTSIGTTASIVPLTIAAIPFFARIVENSLKSCNHGIIDAAQVMGSTTSQMVWKVLIPETLPSLVSGVTLTLVSLIGYSAMAGLVGGGGLGKIAIHYGYQRFNGFLMLMTLVVLLLLVEGVEWLGKLVVRKIERRRGKVA